MFADGSFLRVVATIEATLAEMQGWDIHQRDFSPVVVPSQMLHFGPVIRSVVNQIHGKVVPMPRPSFLSVLQKRRSE